LRYNFRFRLFTDQEIRMADAQVPTGPSLVIERIYVKDLSLENPGAPQSFNTQAAPQVEVGLRSRGEQIAEGVFECVLTLTVTARVEGKTLFLVEAAQAGLFRISGVPLAEIQPILGIHCPAVLFPYARETIASAVMRAGFPPVHLDPINFELLYQQQLAAMQQPQPQPQEPQAPAPVVG
jgi:preprotein translocase subunit SecB